MTKAIVDIGAQQFVVIPGQKIQVNRLEKTPGDSLEVSKVLWLSVNADTKPIVGKPAVPGAMVLCKVLRHFRGEKVIVFKKRSKKGYKKTQGHRSDLTELLVEDIKVG